MSVSTMVLRPRTWGPPRVRSHVTQMFTGRLDDAFELEAVVERRALTLVVPGGPRVLLGERGRHLLFRVCIPNDDEVPGLHEPNRRRMVCRAENAQKGVVRDGVRTKGADIPTGFDHPVKT